MRGSGFVQAKRFSENLRSTEAHAETNDLVHSFLGALSLSDASLCPDQGRCYDLSVFQISASISSSAKSCPPRDILK